MHPHTNAARGGAAYGRQSASNTATMRRGEFSQTQKGRSNFLAAPTPDGVAAGDMPWSSSTFGSRRLGQPQGPLQ